MRSIWGSKVLPVVAVFTMAGAANGGVISYNGFDQGASGPGANATAAHASFVAAVGGGGAITFENLTLGSANNLVVAPGVTVTGDTATIANWSPGLAFYGGNTTPAGSQFLYLVGGSATFTFTTPVDYFGAYFGGLQSPSTIDFNGGSPWSVGILSANANGGFAFAGFTDFGASISSVTISTNGDIMSVDDVIRPTGNNSTPEPSTFVLIGFGLAVLAKFRRGPAR